MFNFKNRKKTMYTINTFADIVDELMRPTNLRTQRTTHRYSNFDVELQDDGKQKVTIPVTGHNPKNISVDVTDTEITIQSKREEDASRYVKDIDLVLSVGEDYDGTRTEAKFDNGLLTLLIDKKTDRKSKSIKVSY